MRLRELRADKHMTQRDLAEAMNVEQNTVSQWESGVRMPRAKILPQLAQILDCTVDELLAEAEQPTA